MKILNSVTLHKVSILKAVYAKYV